MDAESFVRAAIQRGQQQEKHFCGTLQLWPRTTEIMYVAPPPTRLGMQAGSVVLLTWWLLSGNKWMQLVLGLHCQSFSSWNLTRLCPLLKGFAFRMFISMQSGRWPKNSRPTIAISKSTTTSSLRRLRMQMPEWMSRTSGRMSMAFQVKTMFSFTLLSTKPVLGRCCFSLAKGGDGKGMEAILDSALFGPWCFCHTRLRSFSLIAWNSASWWLTSLFHTWN